MSNPRAEAPLGPTAPDAPTVMEKDTVSIHFASAAVARLTAAARRRVLTAAGIPPELLASTQARVPAQAYSALWLAVAREIDDEFFGLDGRRMKVGSFALLCRAVLSSGTLDRAIKQMLRGFAVFLGDIDAELALEDGQAVVTLTNRIADAAARRFADETFLVMVHGLMCWLAGRRIPLQAAEFAHPRPPYAPEYAVMYTQHLRFDAPATAIRIGGGLLAVPVAQDARSLETLLLTAPQSVLLKYKNEDSWTVRLRCRLRDSVGQDGWPTLEDVARESRIGPATLRRLGCLDLRVRKSRTSKRVVLLIRILLCSRMPLRNRPPIVCRNGGGRRPQRGRGSEPSVFGTGSSSKACRAWTSSGPCLWARCRRLRCWGRWTFRSSKLVLATSCCKPDRRPAT